ncbi:UDP-galactopyranose mutase [Psychromonas sp. SA13A]|uniref:UDP-galactopyranose mutase n=1 Tax=Psychromonas sp. SA13A TaxID=2686346 RepID=UPI0014093FCA|nr:UDP-galactopyranose mutase [Psychromonas sp. SA13A]
MQVKKYDVIIVGAGFSGAVVAEQFASQMNKKVLVLEQRNHVAGNCFDKIDSNGVRIHQYGPHLFHTRHVNVWNYLSQFTKWHKYEHKVLGSIDGKLAPVPFNLNSLHVFFPKELASILERKLIAKYGDGAKVPILELKKTDDTQLQELAKFIYDKLFVNYTCKQWGCKPEEIAPEVTARVPVVLSRDDRYFHDKYQGVPDKGYTALVKNILMHKNITTKLSCTASELVKLDIINKKILVSGEEFNGVLVYTGMLDELFNYSLGELPYRSLKFKFEQHDKEYYQPATTVNYPNEHKYTRITEFKHLQPNLSGIQQSTTIVKEFPLDYCRHDLCKSVPYYPILNDANNSKYLDYECLIKEFCNVLIAGRLAKYKYFNMDDTVLNAIEAFEEFRGKYNE